MSNTRNKWGFRSEFAIVFGKRGISKGLSMGASNQQTKERSSPTTDSVIRLDFASFLRDCCKAKRGATHDAKFARSFSGSSSLELRATYEVMRADEFRFSYWTGASQWPPSTKTVCLAICFIPCNYGACRAWACCPSCGRNSRVLWFCRSLIKCRECHSLIYSSTREDRIHRLRRRLRSMRRRIGAGATADFSPLPSKPPRMHSTTWWTVVSKIRDLENQLLDEFATRCPD